MMIQIKKMSITVVDVVRNVSCNGKNNTATFHLALYDMNHNLFWSHKKKLIKAYFTTIHYVIVKPVLRGHFLVKEKMAL
jgi:hypothetical protein